MGALSQDVQVDVQNSGQAQIVSYSATVWVRALDNKKNLKKLERVQALALRIITGAFPSTPSNSLNHLTETPHIGCYLKGEAAKGAASL